MKVKDIPEAAHEDSFTIPELGLLVGVLERAILDSFGEGPSEGYSNDEQEMTRCYIKRSAMRWIASKRTTAFSFKWVCIHLDICPYRLRRVLEAAWKEGKRIEFAKRRVDVGREGYQLKRLSLSLYH